MDMTQFLAGAYLQASDITQPTYLQIARVETAQVQDNGSMRTKPALVFTDNRRAILNKTNTTALAASFGSNSELWIGRQVLVRTEQAMYQGRMVPGLRFYPAQQQAVAAAAPPVPPPQPIPAMPQPAAVFQQPAPAAQQPLPLTPATPPAPAAFPAPPQLPDVPH